ncbi:MAG: hypothetical protein N2Z65_06900 [Clostridiales bacterium]|nr:hypothetical protein [Clostridiales bacterium]
MRQKRLFAISAACYLLSSASVFPMGLGDISGKNGSAPLAIISAVIFWLSLIIAIAAQLLLRRLQKPYKRRLPFSKMALSPPTVFFEAGFLTALLAVIVLSVLNINGFVLFFLLFLMLACSELAVLTMGKFRNKDGKTVFKIYTRNFYLRSDMK